MSFGYVVDDRGPDKQKAGGAGAFALSLLEQPLDAEAHRAACPSCRVIGEPLGCVGLVQTPIAKDVERWLVDRLPEDIEGLPGFLLRKAIGDFGYDGAEARELRRRGLLEAPGPFTRHFGPFFRRFTVSSEQLLDELLCAGDVDPSHALAVLVHLGAVEVDGRALVTLDDGALLADVVAHPETREQRTRCTLPADESDPPAVEAIKRYLRALHASFVLDAQVLLFGDTLPSDE